MWWESTQLCRQKWYEYLFFWKIGTEKVLIDDGDVDSDENCKLFQFEEFVSECTPSVSIKLGTGVQVHVVRIP
jgi:hypothetical protein